MSQRLTVVEGGLPQHSISSLATEFGLDRATIKKVIAHIEPTATGAKGDPMWSMPAVLDAVHEHLSRRGKLPGASIRDPDKMLPRDRKDHYDAETKRLDFELRQGQLVELQEFRDSLSATFKLLKQFMTTISDTLERDLGLTRAQTAHCEKLVRGLLAKFHHQLIEMHSVDESDAESDAED